jgi:hypothetical protein
LKNYYIFFIFLSFTTFLLAGQFIGFSTLPLYLDEEVYVECGLSYVVNSTPPMNCNFEHPPLAKYFIGFFSLLGIAGIVYIVLAIASGVLLYLMIKDYTSGDRCAELSILVFFLFDTTIFNTYRFLLLDPLAVFFALLSIYLFQRGHKWASAVISGSAIASKFSVAPIVAGLWLLLLFKDKRFKESLAYLALAFTAYFSTFIMDLRLGLDGVIRHHVEMFKYMSWRHGFSPAIATLGFMKLIARVEAWRYPGEFTIFISTSGSMVGLVNETYTPVNKWYLVVYTGGGSPLWYTLLPSLIYATYLVLTSKGSRGLNLSVFLSWLSLLNVLAGPIDWYYVNALPFLYMTLVILIQQITPRHYKWILLLLTAIHIASFTLTTLGLIPFKVVFVP